MLFVLQFGCKKQAMLLHQQSGKQRIYTLGRQSYFSEKRLGLQKESSEFLHTESVLLIDKKGRIRGIYNGTDKTEMGRIAGNIRSLLKE